MKHLKSQKKHSKAFRKEAVELLLTGRTITELAAELCVGVSTLHRWKDEYLLELNAQPPDAGAPCCRRARKRPYLSSFASWWPGGACRTVH
jgi:transposase-like protein